MAGEAEFGRAIEELIRERWPTNTEAGDALGVTSQSVANWIAGKPPKPERVFELERALDCVPGTLSRLLRYLPLDAGPPVSVVTTEDAIRQDKRLAPRDRRVLLLYLEGLVELNETERSRPRRSR